MADGNDTADVARRLKRRKRRPRRPSLILVHTHIGYGSPKKQDTFGSHGSPLGEEELQATKKALGWPTMDKFYLPQDAVDHFRKALAAGAAAQQEWSAKFDAYQSRVSRTKPPNSKRLIAANFPKTGPPTCRNGSLPTKPSPRARPAARC